MPIKTINEPHAAKHYGAINIKVIPITPNSLVKQRRTLLHYFAVVVVIAIYGGQVCPFIESLPPAQLLSTIIVIMLGQYAIRYWMHRTYIENIPPQLQASRIFWLELALFICSALILLLFNTLFYDFPVESGIKMLLGYAGLGFFIAIDLTLQHERNVVDRIKMDHQAIDVDRHYFPLTTKLTVIASLCVVFIMAVVFLVVNKDLEWLSQIGSNLTLGDARQAILLELGFIVSVFLSHLLLVIHSYGLNLKLFFQYENRALINATQGNLSGLVPVSSHDEFGVMAKHTNMMIAGLRDLTNELQTNNLQLEEKVKSRTTDLEKANEDLVRLSEAKSEFVSIVSHDLRTPLTSMKLFCEIMLDSLDDDDKDAREEYLSIMNSEIDRLGRLVSNILDFQKISEGKMQWNDAYVDIVEMLRDCARPFKISFETKGIDFEFECNEEEIRTIIDVDRLAQVMYNLLSNSLKFTEQGHVKVILNKLDTVDGERVKLMVSDTGPGMPEDQLKKIFQPYEQIEGSANMGKGTGLGLYITNCVVDRYHGRAWAESVLGEGSTFHIELPISQHVNDVT